jgi:hypothetical protein
VFRNAQVEKNEAKGRKGEQGKRILQQYSCTNSISANPINSVKVNPYTISKHRMNK